MTQPFYLISRTGFARSNGTSVQLSRLLAGREQEVIHLMWDTAEGGATSVPYSIVVEDADGWQWPLARGKGAYAKLRVWLQVGWWAGDQLGVHKLGRRLRSIPVKPHFAYIICMREWDARKILALWRAVGRPEYILHVMDIFHHELSEAETPGFVELIRGAQHVICISGLIAAEVRRCGARQTSILPCGTEFTADNRLPLENPLRIVLSGAIWAEHYQDNSALNVLAAAWPEIIRTFPGAELHYAGAEGAKLPSALRNIVKDHGLVDDATYQDLLHRCHVAYLAVSHPIHTVGRFSVPSRLVDYLACGLPTITCTDEGTSIASFMRSVPAGCAANVADASGLLDAVSRFAANPSSWAQASAAAAAFARQKLRTEMIRKQLFEVFRNLQGLKTEIG